MKNIIRLLKQKRLNFRFPKLSTNPVIPKQNKGVLAVDVTRCNACADCERICPVSAIKVLEKSISIDYSACVWCKLCTLECKEKAIFFVKSHKGTIRRKEDAQHTFYLLSQ